MQYGGSSSWHCSRVPDGSLLGVAPSEPSWADSRHYALLGRDGDRLCALNSGNSVRRYSLASDTARREYLESRRLWWRVAGKVLRLGESILLRRTAQIPRTPCRRPCGCPMVPRTRRPPRLE